MKIYVLKHQDPDFSGMCGRVHFENGIGSTSDDIDAQQCIKDFGCKDVTKEQQKRLETPTAKPKSTTKKKSTTSKEESTTSKK